MKSATAIPDGEDVSYAPWLKTQLHKQSYLTPVVTFGSSSFTVVDFEPIVPVAKRIPPPTTMTISAPTSTPMTPIPPLLSAMNISHGCPFGAIKRFACTFVP
jgi:hypothetical protein